MNHRKCQGDTEVYARVSGFFRPVQQWNKGKRAEYDERVEFVVDSREGLEEPLKGDFHAID